MLICRSAYNAHHYHLSFVQYQQQQQQSAANNFETNHDMHHGHDKSNRQGRMSLCHSRLSLGLSQATRSTCLWILPPFDDDTYYEDTFVDDPFTCSFGTSEANGVWLNHRDKVGTVVAMVVWVLVFYCGFTILLLAQQGDCPIVVAIVHISCCTLALASHMKTMLTDPGAVPSTAVPLVTTGIAYHTMCSLCRSYKPNGTHHCRICNRCVSRMDHHCPWMNNCIGAANLKHFILFLVYTWLGSALSLSLFAVSYFYCREPAVAGDDVNGAATSQSTCSALTGLELLLVRVMTLVCLGALLFTTSMLSSVLYGIYTGIGTIDRLKRKATNTWHDTTEEPVPWKEIFGIGSRLLWILPTDPDFEDTDGILGFATRQRLLRHQETIAKETVIIGGVKVTGTGRTRSMEV